jgi:hypothetical protein
VAGVALLLGVQPTPGLDGHGAVLVVDHEVAGGRGRPSGRVGAVELGPVAARPATPASGRWWRVGVEAAVRPQPHQHRDGDLGQVEGELGGVVAGVEHKQWDRSAGGQPGEQPADLRCGGLVSVVQWMQATGVHRGSPGVPVEADVGDPLEGPASDDWLAGRMARGMVVVAALGRALSVAARPGADIDREHWWVGGRQAACQQVAQPLGIDLAMSQGGIGAAPAAPVGRLQAQVWQRWERLGAQQRVAKLKQRIGAAWEASVQLVAESAKPHQGGRWHRHDRAA